VVLIGVVGQRLDENAETLSVQHRLQHTLELCRREPEPGLRHRVRAPGLVTQCPDLDANVAASLPKPFGALLVEAVSDADTNVELDVRQHIAVLRFTSGYGNCAMYAKNVGSARG